MEELLNESEEEKNQALFSSTDGDDFSEEEAPLTVKHRSVIIYPSSDEENIPSETKDLPSPSNTRGYVSEKALMDTSDVGFN